MPALVVCSTWGGCPDGPPRETRVVADCPSLAEAEGLAEAEAYCHSMAAQDPDTGAWWASDPGQVHKIEVTMSRPTAR